MFFNLCWLSKCRKLGSYWIKQILLLSFWAVLDHLQFTLRKIITPSLQVSHWDRCYLNDLLWYIAECETIEPLMSLEHIGQNPPIQLIGNLPKQPWWTWKWIKYWKKKYKKTYNFCFKPLWVWDLWHKEEHQPGFSQALLPLPYLWAPNFQGKTGS